MKAIRIYNYGHVDELKLEEVERPAATSGQVLVKIRAAGINPVDLKIREGYLKGQLNLTFPLTMGQDFSGEVVEVGSGANTFRTGDRVFGFAPGSYSEYASIPLTLLSLLPESIDYETAAALPTPGSTALQIIRDVIQAKSHMKILIHGAAGAVGSFAVQLAKNAGARIIATASRDDESYLQKMGVEKVIDHKAQRFEQLVNGMDAVLDLIGGDTLLRSYPVLKKNGVLVTTVQKIDEEKANQFEIRAHHFVMSRNASDLTDLTKLVNQGILKPRLAQVLPLDQAKKAQKILESGQARGKIILKVA